jgi:methionine-rich copper-binding protein CopC
MLTIVIATAAACLMTGSAYAHAFLDRASPAVGSEISSSPPVLTLTYTEPVEPLFCTVHVTDDHGTTVEDRVCKPVGFITPPLQSPRRSSRSGSRDSDD